MESITTTKEEYHNILNELLELPYMPDIGEPGVYWHGGNNENLTLNSPESYSQALHNNILSTKS